MTYTWKFGENCSNIRRIEITKFFSNVTSSKFSNGRQSSKSIFYLVAWDFSFNFIFMWTDDNIMLSDINNIKWFVLIQSSERLTL